MGKLEKVRQFYEGKIKNRTQSRFQIWERGEAVGPSMTPSTMHQDYRDKLVSILDDLASHTSGSRILSIGCGNGFVERDLLKLGYQVLATDVCKEALELAEAKGLNTMYLNATEGISCIDEAFDLIFFDGVIGHLFDDSGSVDYIFQELHRVLSPQGVVLIGNGIPDNAENIWHLDRADYFYTSQAFLESRLKDSGFEAIQSILVVYQIPEVGIRTRVWSYGFKPRNKEAVPDYNIIRPYKTVTGVSVVQLSDSAPFTYVIVQPSVSTPPHFHPYTYHEIYVITGNMEFIVDDITTRLQSSFDRAQIINKDFLSKLPVVKILPNQTHSIRNIGKNSAEILCYENPPHK